MVYTLCNLDSMQDHCDAWFRPNFELRETHGHGVVVRVELGSTSNNDTTIIMLVTDGSIWSVYDNV